MPSFGDGTPLALMKVGTTRKRIVFAAKCRFATFVVIPRRLILVQVVCPGPLGAIWFLCMLLF